LLAFIGTVLISLAWGRAFRDVFVQDLGSPFVMFASGLVMVLLPATFLVVINTVHDLGWLKAIVWVFLASGLISLVVELYISANHSHSDAVRTFVNSNGLVWINTHGLFAMWYASLSLALALFDAKLPSYVRVGLLLHALGWVFWGFWQRTSWLSGWVPTFAALAVIAFLRSKKLFIVLVVIMAIGVGGHYWRNYFAAESRISGMTRLAAYAVNWRVTGKHWLFGTGPAGYASYYMSYFPTEAMATHSNYLDVIAQTGIVGSLLVCWFFGAQLWGGYSFWRTVQARGDFVESVSAAALAGTTGCVLAMGLGDWLFPFAYTQGIVGFDGAVINWVFMGMLWAVRSMHRQGATADE
jgi:hypothetical protein